MFGRCTEVAVQKLDASVASGKVQNAAWLLCCLLYSVQSVLVSAAVVILLGTSKLGWSLVLLLDSKLAAVFVHTGWP